MIEFYPEGRLIETADNLNACKSQAHLNEAYSEGKILEARAVICDSSHNLIVDLGCMKGIIPREEGAVGIREGTMRDIAVISRVNRPVCFVITGFERDENGSLTAVLSRRQAQERCIEQYISRLVPGDVIDARVTHLETFGAFADIGCGVVSLMPIDTISVSRIEHPAERFAVGMDIRAVVKTVEKGRISLSHKELLGTWEENAQQFKPGENGRGYHTFCRGLRRLRGAYAKPRGACGNKRGYPFRTAGKRIHKEHHPCAYENQAYRHRHL